VRHIFQPTIGFLHLGQHRLDLGQASLQKGIFPGENNGIHGAE
jgi:hypothetical protein